MVGYSLVQTWQRGVSVRSPSINWRRCRNSLIVRPMLASAPLWIWPETMTSNGRLMSTVVSCDVHWSSRRCFWPVIREWSWLKVSLSDFIPKTLGSMLSCQQADTCVLARRSNCTSCCMVLGTSQLLPSGVCIDRYMSMHVTSSCVASVTTSTKEFHSLDQFLWRLPLHTQQNLMKPIQNSIYGFYELKRLQLLRTKGISSVLFIILNKMIIFYIWIQLIRNCLHEPCLLLVLFQMNLWHWHLFVTPSGDLLIQFYTG